MKYPKHEQKQKEEMIMAEEMTKKETGGTTKISATVLGQKRAEYGRLASKGIEQSRIDERMAEDSLQFGITLDQYTAQLESLKASGSGDDLEAKRADHRAQLEAQLLDFVGYLNGLLKADLDNAEATEWLKGFQSSARAFQQSLANSEFTTRRGKQSWMIMLHSPVYNLITEKPIDKNLFAPFVGGWTDKGRSYDQYGIRMQAGGSATFYRPVSYKMPVKPPPKA